MALIKTETFTNEETGVEMIREYYGKDEEHISATVEKPIEEDTEPEFEEPIQDELNAEMLLNQTTIIAKQEEQDEVLAEILLNQMEG